MFLCNADLEKTTELPLPELSIFSHTRMIASPHNYQISTHEKCLSAFVFAFEVVNALGLNAN